MSLDIIVKSRFRVAVGEEYFRPYAAKWLKASGIPIAVNLIFFLALCGDNIPSK